MSGLRRHKIVLQTREESLNAYGEADLSYNKLADAWAEVRMVSGNERLISAQIESEVSHRIRLRWEKTFAKLTPKDRLLHDGKTYDIVSVTDPDGRRRELVLTALERLD